PSAFAYFWRIRAVSSVEPSSTMMNSKSRNVWSRMLHTASSKNSAALNAGITTRRNRSHDLSTFNTTLNDELNKRLGSPQKNSHRRPFAEPGRELLLQFFSKRPYDDRKFRLVF